MKSIKNLGGTKEHNRKLSFCLKVYCTPIICMGRVGIRGSLVTVAKSPTMRNGAVAKGMRGRCLPVEPISAGLLWDWANSLSKHLEEVNSQKRALGPDLEKSSQAKVVALSDGRGQGSKGCKMVRWIHQGYDLTDSQKQFDLQHHKPKVDVLFWHFVHRKLSWAHVQKWPYPPYPKRTQKTFKAKTFPGFVPWFFSPYSSKSWWTSPQSFLRPEGVHMSNLRTTDVCCKEPPLWIANTLL